MATLAQLTTSIQSIIRNETITDLTDRINNAVCEIAGGVQIPTGQFSPPLPDLHSTATLTTTASPFVALPDDYQRHVFYVTDPSGDRILPPRGGDYYSFLLFMNAIRKKGLDEAGSVTNVAVKGLRLYYQGIPAVFVDLGIMYHRLPVPMVMNIDTPDGIPSHLQTKLIKHAVCRDVIGDIQEGGKKQEYSYHTERFWSAMFELIDFVGEADAEPIHYGNADSYDLTTD